MKKAVPKLNLSRFQPMSDVATAKINELIAAGARLILVERGRVQMRRLESLATIDGCGRVTWEAAPKSR